MKNMLNGFSFKAHERKTIDSKNSKHHKSITCTQKEVSVFEVVYPFYVVLKTCVDSYIIGFHD